MRKYREFLEEFSELAWNIDEFCVVEVGIVVVSVEFAFPDASYAAPRI